MIHINVRIRKHGLQNLLTGLRDMSGPLRDVTYQWAARYRAAMRERFADYSRGGGDWAPLAESTRLARRDPKGRTGAGRIAMKRRSYRKALKTLQTVAGAPLTKRNVTRKTNAISRARKAARAVKKEVMRQAERRIGILWDTGVLIGALSPEAEGWVEHELPNGIEVGFGGPAMHGTDQATIADIASFHQEGGPNLPQREILVEPSEQVKEAMAEDMDRAIQKVIDQTKE